ncbi:MAG: DUF1080 domain-containing protein [Pirellulales bacterium]
MKSLAFSSLMYLLSVAAYAEDGFHKYECLGSDNYPLIPGATWKVHDIARPHPTRIIPGSYVERGVLAAPADAEILFDGTSLEHFQENQWHLKEGFVVAGKGGLTSKKGYGDCQLHIEWRTPSPSATTVTWNMGNSGIYFMGLYELQVFDSYSCKVYPDGSAGALYGQTPPLVNVARKPGEWQTFDVLFTAPVFEGDKLTSSARMTVLHNGAFVQVNTELTGPTNHKEPTPYAPHRRRLPFFLQGNKSPVEYRNIWIRDLSQTKANE